MAYRNLLLADDGAVRTITINRPDKLNALNRETLADLHAAFEQARHDDAVRAVILTGAGPKAFVAGADITEFASLPPAQVLEFSRFGQALMTRVERLGKPVVAAIGGFALGGGMELAMACTLRIAAETARLGQPEINLGTIPGFGGTQRLLRLAGRSAALELCLLGAPITAPRAFELGIVNRVVPADQLETEARKVAAQLAASAPHALRGVLDAVLLGGEAPLDVGLDYESQAFAVCAATEDMREGTRAFIEKRKPAFTGR
jgi:enoyl-CoA hydratase